MNLNASVNHSKDLVLISPVAISDKIGVDSIGHAQGTGESVSQLGQGSQQTETGTLSSIFAEQPYKGFLSAIDFVKIDIEGSEVKIFKNNELINFIAMIRVARIDANESPHIKEKLTVEERDQLYAANLEFRPHVYLSIHAPFLKNVSAMSCPLNKEQLLDEILQELKDSGYKSFYDPICKKVIKREELKKLALEKHFPEIVCLGSM
jgi:Methyltransferase FkbM domain